MHNDCFDSLYYGILKRLEKEKMTKFKIGDRVRKINNSDNYIWNIHAITPRNGIPVYHITRLSDNITKDYVEKIYDTAVEDELQFVPDDNVNHPSHYCTGKYECIDVMIEVFGVEAVKNFCLCNSFKYNYRSGRKNGKEDLEKAIWYSKKYLELCNISDEKVEKLHGLKEDTVIFDEWVSDNSEACTDELKIGTIVECIDYTDDKYFGRTGRIIEIKYSTIDDTIYIVEFNDDNTREYTRDQLDIEPKKDISENSEACTDEFKIGDKVKVIAKGPYENEIGIIIGLMPDGRINLSFKNGNVRTTCMFCKDKIEKIIDNKNTERRE